MFFCSVCSVPYSEIHPDREKEWPPSIPHPYSSIIWNHSIFIFNILIISKLKQEGVKQENKSGCFSLLFLMKIITFTIYLYHILLRNGTDAGVTDPAHCSQGRPTCRDFHKGNSRINPDCCTLPDWKIREAQE